MSFAPGAPRRGAVKPPAAPGAGREELAVLLARQGAPRRLLRQRVAVFVCVGAALGALHLVTARAGGDHVALTAMLAALIPVFAPVCFVPAVFAGRERGGAGAAVAAARLGVVAALGWAVASVHLLVWEGLAALTGSIGGPGAGDLPFMVVAVLATAAVATLAYELPLRERWAQPAAVAAVVAAYVVSFLVHGLLLRPSLAAVRDHLGAAPGAIEAAIALVALLAVWALMRREVHDGARKAVGAGGTGPTVAGGAGPAVAAGARRARATGS